jgi:hypothetical protein
MRRLKGCWTALCRVTTTARTTRRFKYPHGEKEQALWGELLGKGLHIVLLEFKVTMPSSGRLQRVIATIAGYSLAISAFGGSRLLLSVVWAKASILR